MSLHQIVDQDRIAELWDAVKEYVDEHGGGSGGVAVGSDVPIGAIMFWSGSADDVPAGWHICDGTEGTVDLRDKFILSAGTAHEVGETGGSEEVTLTVEQMPKHMHNVSRFLSSEKYTSATLSSGDYHALNTSRTHIISSGEAGSSQAHNNMPPYYALCAIQKVSSGSSGNGGMTAVDGTPIGTVISYMGLTAPNGYLICDGTVYNITDYPDLAAFFVEQFGSSSYFGGNGTTTFAVPDMRNLFLRGYHGNTTVLSGNVGVKQNATEHPNVAGAKNPDGLYVSYVPSGRNLSSTNVTFSATNSDTSSGSVSAIYNIGDITASGEEKINKTYTSRPVNMAVLYCIKAST